MNPEQTPFDSSKKLVDQLDIDFALQAAGLGVWEVDPTTNQVLWDDRCRELFGLAKDNLLSYQEAIQYIHPQDRDRVNQAVKAAMAPRSNGLYDQTYRTLGADDGQLRWVRFHGRSYFTPAGELSRFAGIAQDVTAQMIVQESQQEVAEREARFRTLIEEAPVATCLFVGQELRIEIANEAMIKVWGKGSGVIGMPLTDALPELRNQHFPLTIRGLFTTGNTFSTKAGRADLVIDGQLQTFYFDYDFKPLRAPDGSIYAILETAVDVTKEVKALRKIQETETTLRGVIEVAEMGLWELDMGTGVTTYSDRLKLLFEFTQDYIEMDQLYNPILEADQQRLMEAVARAADPRSDGLLDEEYTIITQRTGRHRLVRAQAKMYFDEGGKAQKLSGSMRDVTEQRAVQLALEQQVQQRTDELAAANEELAATNEELAASNGELASSNEEYAAINEELTASGEEVDSANKLLGETNIHLVRSNQNLEQFAYIASHDLQEPLRKIQQFGDLLRTRYAGSTGDELVYLDRMQVAARRMSLLIKDLLSFSRISTSQVVQVPVALVTVVQNVLDTLSIVIEEAGAQIQVEALPLVQGDATQLEQLFQNLLANAIKFSRQNETGQVTRPAIAIRARQVMATELPKSLSLSRPVASYHLIEVKDNGIGFDEKYTPRIFQVFQRLHGRNEFAGTGVGLAIVEKVVTNHGGAITAHSQPGQGATFSVYLPA